MMIVMPPISAIVFSPPASMLKPSQNTGYSRATEVHAGHDHRGRVDQGRHRRGAGHGVGEPGVQRELAALADDGDEQRDRGPQQHGVGRARATGPSVLVSKMLNVARPEEQDRDADEQADVADAGGEERLQGGVGVLLLLPPVPDQDERAEAHDLPAEQQLERVLGDDQA